MAERNEKKNGGNNFLNRYSATAVATVFTVIFMVLIFCFWIGPMVKEAFALSKEISLEKQEITTEKVYLANINYSSEFEGTLSGSVSKSFVMGYGTVTGSFGEKQYYVSYKILDDGGKQLYKMPADVTTIYDSLTESETAYAEIDANNYGTNVVAIRLYVPVGTIVEDYDLRFEN